MTSKSKKRRKHEATSSLLSAADGVTASAVAALVVDMTPWVNRAVEQVEVIDDVAVERRHSVDFTVPSAVDGIDTEGALSFGGSGFVPITFLRKERLRNFDLRDAGGCPVPMLSRRDNGELATRVLVAQAEGVLGAGLPRSIWAHLVVVAEGDPSVAAAEFQRWPEYASDPCHPDQASWALLTERKGFRDLALALVSDFIVCAVIDPRPGVRQVLKLSYEQPFGHSTRSFLAWRYKALSFKAPQSALAESYHFEMAAPPDTEAVGGLLLASGGEGAPDPDIDVPVGQRVHLYNRHSGSDVETFVFLRARRQGYVRAAGLVGFLAAALLWATYAYLPDVGNRTNSQVTATLLLLGPTLFAAVLVRPGEHRLVTAMLFWVRTLVVGCMVACIVVVTLLAGVATEARSGIWLGAAVLASVCAAGLIAATILPRGVTARA